jgi:UDP-N-acetylglucosamine 2-epimerase (non-hydrolysing)
MAIRKNVVVHVVGARPNYMKIAPVYAELERCQTVEQRLVHTGQHYDDDLSSVFFEELSLPPPHLQLGVGSGSHAQQTARALVELERAFVDLRPDVVVAPGDVNSTLAAALAAAKLNIRVCHLEAGLRSFDSTMPEEHNRRLTDHLSSLLLTHCEDANANLAAEGISGDRVAFVGNTMIDTLLANVEVARRLAAWNDYRLPPRGYVLVTFHRPRLVDDRKLMRAMMDALTEVSASMPVLFPVHPRTRARIELDRLPAGGNVIVADPLPYRTFLSVQTAAAAVVTDSGGIQEEATALGVPCFTLRENTERPVTITDGTNVLLGLDPARICEIPKRLRTRHKSVVPRLWDGMAGRRAANAIVEMLERVEFEGRRRSSGKYAPALAYAAAAQ